MRTQNSQALSLALHAAGLSIVLFLTARSSPKQPAPLSKEPILIAPLRFRPAMAHSGGSNDTPLPARRGQPPPKSTRQFVSPAAVDRPHLPIPITVDFDSPTIDISAASIGDPTSALLTASFGDRHGVGTGERPGGRGLGPSDSGSPVIDPNSHAHSITRPVLLYRVDPEFSEEARKAKHQGVVVLAIEVDTNGQARNLRVIQGLGLGLDEKAIEAVSRWRFRPGMEDGRPVVMAATIEVNFRLL